VLKGRRPFLIMHVSSRLFKYRLLLNWERYFPSYINRVKEAYACFRAASSNSNSRIFYLFGMQDAKQYLFDLCHCTNLGMSITFTYRHLFIPLCVQFRNHCKTLVFTVLFIAISEYPTLVCNVLTSWVGEKENHSMFPRFGFGELQALSPA
jgi:hypothetical protein